jgi:uncharacterized membrane protein
MFTLSLYAQAVVYIGAGIMHFVAPRSYLAIMPPWVPSPSLAVSVSGVAEIVCGLGLLFPATRTLAVWGLIALLIAVFPANVHMATDPRFHQLPQWAMWGRLPIQALLIWWAWSVK